VWGEPGNLQVTLRMEPRYVDPAKCGECVAACQAGAVAQDMIPETFTLEVGAVILAPGFSVYDPSKYQAYPARQD